MIRLVHEDVASYREICEYWDLDEVMEEHEILNIRADQAWKDSQRGPT